MMTRFHLSLVCFVQLLVRGLIWLRFGGHLVVDAASEPTITGAHDFDRTWWGDPAADRTIRMIAAKPDERQAFWDTYGPLDQSAIDARASRRTPPGDVERTAAEERPCTTPLRARRLRR